MDRVNAGNDCGCGERMVKGLKTRIACQHCDERIPFVMECSGECGVLLNEGEGLRRDCWWSQGEKRGTTAMKPI